MYNYLGVRFNTGELNFKLNVCPLSLMSKCSVDCPGVNLNVLMLS